MTNYYFYTFGICTGVNLTVFLGVWLWQLKYKNAGIIDAFWGLMLGAQACIYAFSTPEIHQKNILYLLLIAVWTGRLTVYLFLRNVGQPEDKRYADMRVNTRLHPELKMLGVFLLQWFLNTVLAFPFYFIFNQEDFSYSLAEQVGLFLLVTAIIGETMADRQLHIFKSNPQNKGQVLQTGLWAYTRHPNYFFQWLAWVGVFLLALNTPWGWVSIYAPVVMYVLLTKVTGVTLTEAVIAETKGEAYKKYAQNVPAFFPKLPKNGVF